MLRTLIAVLLLASALSPSFAQKTKGTAKKKASATAVQQKSGTKKTTQQKSGTKSVKGLQNEQATLKKKIKQNEQQLRSNEQDVKKRLQSLVSINAEIKEKRKSIDTLKHRVDSLERTIAVTERQLDSLQQELDDKKEKYVKSIRYMHRNRAIQNQLMFIFSAKSLTQMYRRMRFMKEYATYQRMQGEKIREEEKEINRKRSELLTAKANLQRLLARGEEEQAALEAKEKEQQAVVKTLRNKQKQIRQVIEAQRKKDAELDKEIDRLIAIEIEQARKRAEEEARKKAAAEAKSKGEEKGKSKKETKKSAEAAFTESAEDRALSGSFESNKGRLPMPITGQYRIVSGFGEYNVEGLKGVKLDNKGINIQGKPGAQARSVFDGEVSAVFSFGGTTGVMVRHGSYISVYCNLSSVSVRKGQKVSTRQTIGTIGKDNILQFQLRKEKAKLNPEQWLGR